jgi:aspartyl-tRNA(Asn)/glutamyl-tRNA(Gln) amidotransferase subunit A
MLRLVAICSCCPGRGRAVRLRGHLEFAFGSLSLHVGAVRVNGVSVTPGTGSAYDLSSMLEKVSPLTLFRQALAARRITPQEIAASSIEHANSNQSQNTYLYFNADELLRRADSLSEEGKLFGVPISLKDCFDLAGTHTTCGSPFYAASNELSAHDSAVAQCIHNAGALLTGKTHLHPLAYGITGQNPDYGDCLQPRDASVLTGGSSSGAVASVQEGSALVGIGTDTGGSIRVPAALGGLTGFRASHSLASSDGPFPRAWDGAAHLAPSFDTLGFILRDPRDVVLVAESLFSIPTGATRSSLKIGCVPQSFLYDCQPDVLSAYHSWQQVLTSMGSSMHQVDTSWWSDAFDVFAAIQAHEASQIHSGNYHQFDEAIRARLEWGASIASNEVDALRLRHQQFRVDMDKLFARFDLLMLPASPVARLVANTDLSDARRQILRYTTPFSLAGLPALSLPGETIGAAFGTGVQIAAAPGADPMLVAFAAFVGDFIVRQGDRPPDAKLL